MQFSVANWCLAAFAILALPAYGSNIAHDAEYYVLEKQNGERWTVEDKDLDERLAEFRKKNGGKSPNIFYILIDDIGFGDLGQQAALLPGDFAGEEGKMDL